MSVGKKYFWTRKEEARLMELWRKGIRDFKVLGKELGRTPRAIKLKLTRLGVVVMKQKMPRTTTTAIEDRGLLTHEETLKLLAGVLTALREPGQDRLELQRLRILVNALQTYDSTLEKFERWVEIENRLLAMDKQIRALQQAQTVQS